MSTSYRYNLDWNVDADSVVDLLRIRHNEIMQSEAQCIKFFDYLLPMIHTAIDRSNQFKAARLLEQLDIKNVTNIPHDNGVLFNIRISEDLSIVIGYGELHSSFSYDAEFTLGNYDFQLINFINLSNLPHVRIYVKTPKVVNEQPDSTAHFKCGTYLDIVPFNYAGTMVIKSNSDEILIEILSEYLSYIHPEYSVDTITAKAVEKVLYLPWIHDIANSLAIDNLKLKHIYVSEAYGNSLKRRICTDTDTITWATM